MAGDIETKLAVARTRLVMSKPFLGALVLRLPMVAARSDWCPTTGTDARRFYYNPDYIDALSLDNVQFVLAHEALHCALAHFARRGHRVKKKWDLACDFAINPLLAKEGFKPPPGVLVLDAHEGMTAEEIYPTLSDMDNDEPMDRHLYDGSEGGSGGGGGQQQKRDQGGKEDPGQQQGPKEIEDPRQERQQNEDGNGGEPPPLTAQERESLEQKWRQYLASAAQQAKQAGKFGGLLARMVEELLEPRLAWRAVLARHLSLRARDDYSYMRPSRREGDMILPRLRSEDIDVVVALDTSGSITQEELSQFVSEIDALKGQLRARVTLLTCDARLADDGPWRYESWEPFTLPREFKGGGGTVFQPVFDWVASQDVPPDVLVYFTDGEGDFPRMEPGYPVIWLIKGKGQVPWGERIQLN